MNHTNASQDRTFDLPVSEVPPTDNVLETKWSCSPLSWHIVVVIVVVSAVILTTIIGNLLIVISYCKDDQLRRKVHNLYLLHLAVSDLLVGVVSMPMYLVYTACGLSWPLGEVPCKVFLLQDETACTVSTLLVTLIAADRLALVRLGARYTTVHTRRRAYVMLAACWVLAFLLFSPVIILSKSLHRDSVLKHLFDCDIRYADNFYFVVITEIIAFFVPFFLMTIFTVKLLLALKNRSKVAQSVRSSSEQSGVHRDSVTVDPSTSFSMAGLCRKNSQPPAVPLTSSHCCRVCCKNSQDNLTRSPSHKERRGIKKAVRISFLLVFAMAVLWMPYCIATIVISACENCVNVYLYEAFIWMIWVKSTINPFLYAFFSPRLRENSLRFLLALTPARCLCKRSHECSENAAES